MKRLLSDESLAYVGHLKNLLELAGIACVIRNEQLSGGLGEIPFLDCLPELWVMNDHELGRARALVAEATNAETSQNEWRCPSCGAQNEGQFAACWQCGGADLQNG